MCPARKRYSADGAPTRLGGRALCPAPQRCLQHAPCEHLRSRHVTLSIDYHKCLNYCTATAAVCLMSICKAGIEGLCNAWLAWRLCDSSKRLLACRAASCLQAAIAELSVTCLMRANAGSRMAVWRAAVRAQPAQAPKSLRRTWLRMAASAAAALCRLPCFLEASTCHLAKARRVLKPCIACTLSAARCLQCTRVVALISLSNSRFPGRHAFTACQALFTWRPSAAAHTPARP